MSYLVLARKWRPKTFAELVGQEHVVRALESGLGSGRLHHAFLFTGTRGVGKTTIARIIAKALNCETGVSANPCGVCSACTDIDQGRFVDLMEIDAASRTKVDDTRELLDNVIYAPARGRYKVYLIDEVHMLSAHSFNALLKTLEEPPPHVKFLLATTDPQKLPVTVLSRCLKFHLKRMSVTQVQQQMQHILGAEQIPFETEALTELARAADGSMRDGLSLLDQAIGYGGGRVDAQATREMLGSVARDALLDLLLAIAAGETARTWEVLGGIVAHNPNYHTVCGQLLELLHDAAVQQALGAQSGLLELPAKVIALAAQLQAAELQLLYQICLMSTRDLALAPDPRMAFEMAVLRLLSFAPHTPASGGTSSGPAPRERPAPVSGSASGQSATSTRPDPDSTPPWETAPAPTAPAVAPMPRPATPVTTRAAVEPAPAPAADVSSAGGFEVLRPPAKPKVASETLAEPQSEAALAAYAALFAELPLNGPLKQLALQCSVQRCDSESLQLRLPVDWAYLLSEHNRQQLVQLIQTARPGVQVQLDTGTPYGTSLAARLAEQEKRQRAEFSAELQRDPLVQALVQQFDARIVPESVQMDPRP